MYRGFCSSNILSFRVIFEIKTYLESLEKPRNDIVYGITRKGERKKKEEKNDFRIHQIFNSPWELFQLAWERSFLGLWTMDPLHYLPYGKDHVTTLATRQSTERFFDSLLPRELWIDLFKGLSTKDLLSVSEVIVEITILRKGIQKLEHLCKRQSYLESAPPTSLGSPHSSSSQIHK